MARRNRSPLALLLLLPLVFPPGCADGGSDGDADTDADVDTDTDADTDADTDPPELWPDPQLSFDLAPTLAGLELPPFAAWGQHEDKVALAAAQGVTLRRLEPEPMQLGLYGLGNGRCFATVGATYPMNSLHGLMGPDLQKGNQGYFADLAVHLGPAPYPEPFDEEWVLRPAGLPFPLTQGLLAERQVVLQTLDFAPRGLDITAAGAERALLRVAVVHNRGAAPLSNLALLTTSGEDVELADGRLRHSRADRLLEIGCLTPGCTTRPATPAEPGGLTVDLEGLDAGEERLVVLALVFSELDDTAARAESWTALAATDWTALLAQTRAWWEAWLDGTLTLQTPDRRVDDLLTGLKLMLKQQQAVNGAASAMSHYAGFWPRDLTGWVHHFLTVGRPDDAAAILDYMLVGAREVGGYYNAVDANLDPDRVPPEPDWSALGPTEDVRTGGEGPSYIPWLHSRYYRATGDLQRLRDRWDYLEYGLRVQWVTDAGLIPFSGDETFRPPMAMNLGIGDASYPFEDLTWSANSGFLYVVAAEGLAEAAAAAGDETGRAALQARADEIRASTDAHYWLADRQSWAPLIYVADGQREPQPHEDVSTKPLWTGYLGPDDPRAAPAIASLRDAWDRGAGVVVSHSDQSTELFGIEVGNGIYTGMSPGYLLHNLAVLDDPYAEQAFDSLGTSTDPSGNFAEVYAYDTRRPLQPFYLASGGQGELWARYRPWEGGINGDAVLFYLLGNRVHCPDRRLELGPRLPHRWPRLDATAIPVCPGESVDLTVTHDRAAGTWEVRLDPHLAAGPAAVTLTLRPDAATLGEVRVDDTALDEAALERWIHHGRARARLALELEGERPVVVTAATEIAE